jgi:hypothetical protein
LCFLLFEENLDKIQQLSYPHSLSFGGTSMKFFPAFGILVFALTFCGIGDRLKQASSGTANSAANSSGNSAKSSTSGTTTEKPELTSAQQAITDASTEVMWSEQGVAWKVPSG